MPVKYNATDWVRGGGDASSKLNPNITSSQRLVFSRHYFANFAIIGQTNQVLITNFTDSFHFRISIYS